MDYTDKVIPLPQRVANGGELPAHFAALLQDYQALALRHLEGLLPGFFEQVDDTLFELADKAETDAIQSAYFDAMREVRLKRQNIQTIFKERLGQSFARVGGVSSEAAAPRPERVSSGTLQLVDEAELEESLAVTGMVEKIEGICRDDLYGLEERFGYCVREAGIKSAENPATPKAICNAFRVAVQVMDADLKIRLIFLKLFDMHVAASLGPFYREANQLFLQAGILPDLKPYVRADAPNAFRRPPRRPAHASEGTSGRPRTQGVPSSYEDETFLDVIRGLLAESRGGIAPLGGSFYGSIGPGIGLGDFPDRGVLLQTLSALQVPLLQETGTAAQQSVVLPGGVDLRGMLVGAIQDKTGKPARLSPGDTDVIDVISLLFEFILDDANLPVAVKAWLARLQIPLVKVALLDKEFFSKQGHPARRLVNELARAGLGIDKDSTPEENKRLAKIQEIVERILAEFTDNLDLFPRLLEEFTTFMADLAAEEAAITAAKAEEYRQRELRLRVREEIAGTIDEHMKGPDVPPVLHAFLTGPWLDVLVETRVANAADETWKKRLELVPELIWSVEPKRLPSDKRALALAIPRLLQTIRDGLDAIAFPPDNRDEVLSALEALHLASFRGESQPVGAVPAGPVPEPRSQDGVKEAIAAMDEQMASIAKLDALLDEEMSQSGSVSPHHDPEHYIEEIVLEDGSALPHPVINDEFQRQVEQLKCGTWIEFRLENDRRERLRLAWKSNLLGECTLLNWKCQATDRTVAELADDLRQGRAAVIQDAPLMDRALEAIVRRLSGKR